MENINISDIENMARQFIREIESVEYSNEQICKNGVSVSVHRISVLSEKVGILKMLKCIKENIIKNKQPKPIKTIVT